MKNEWVIQKGKAKQNDLTGHRQALMVTFFDIFSLIIKF